MKRVVITGTGIVSCIGNDNAADGFFAGEPLGHPCHAGICRDGPAQPSGGCAAD